MTFNKAFVKSKYILNDCYFLYKTGSNHFCKPSFPGHQLEMSNACGLYPLHFRHFCVAVHVNLDTAEILLPVFDDVERINAKRAS